MTQPPAPQPPPPPPAGWGGPTPGSIYPGGAPGTTGIAGAKTSGLAIASLVTGLFFWCCAVPGIVAIVLGHLALESIEDSGGTKSGRGMAIAGIVLGWVGVAIAGVIVLGWFLNVLTI